MVPAIHATCPFIVVPKFSICQNKGWRIESMALDDIGVCMQIMSATSQAKPALTV
jgi:hypothetical protein